MVQLFCRSNPALLGMYVPLAKYFTPVGYLSSVSILRTYPMICYYVINLIGQQPKYVRTYLLINVAVSFDFTVHSTNKLTYLHTYFNINETLLTL